MTYTIQENRFRMYLNMVRIDVYRNNVYNVSSPVPTPPASQTTSRRGIASFCLLVWCVYLCGSSAQYQNNFFKLVILRDTRYQLPTHTLIAMAKYVQVVSMSIDVEFIFSFIVLE